MKWNKVEFPEAELGSKIIDLLAQNGVTVGAALQILDDCKSEIMFTRLQPSLDSNDSCVGKVSS